MALSRGGHQLVKSSSSFCLVCQRFVTYCMQNRQTRLWARGPGQSFFLRLGKVRGDFHFGITDLRLIRSRDRSEADDQAFWAYGDCVAGWADADGVQIEVPGFLPGFLGEVIRVDGSVGSHEQHG